MYSDNFLIDELSVLGWTVFDAAVSGGLTSHIHDMSYEVCYIAQGEVHWWVNDTDYTIKRGDYFVTKPGEQHGGVNGVMERCELYWLQFRVPPEGNPLPGLSSHETQALLMDLSSLKHRAFPALTPLHAVFHRMLSEHREPGVHAALLTRTALYEILINLIRSHRLFEERQTDIPSKYSNEIAHALAWIEDHLSRKITVHDIADMVNMSVGYLQKRFLEEVGITPGEYCTRRRIEEARRLLLSSEQSVSDLAFRLGFASSQYFATVFRKYTGTTPREYRRLHTT